MWREVSNPYAAIGWIREELNNLLRQVRIGLEAAAEENDLSLLENAENALEKLHLTLEMLRSPGASLLADEMRGLLSALRNDQIEDTDSSCVNAGFGDRRYLPRSLASRGQRYALIVITCFE